MNEEHHTINTDRIMIDLETMSTAPAPAIVAVAAVRFGPGGVAQNTFYRRVDLASSMAAGLITDAEAIRWWLRQGEAARDEVARLPGENLDAVLYQLEQWIGWNGVWAVGEKAGQRVESDGEIWGNGAVSDPVWLESAYGAVGFEVPWRHHQVRCFRTLKHLLPWVPAPPMPEVPHHALQDAVHQAEHAVALLRELERMRPPAVGWGAVPVEAHELPCAACGDTGTAADGDGRPVACGCWMGRAGMAAAAAIRAVQISSGGPPMAVLLRAADQSTNQASVSNSPAAGDANESAKTTDGIDGASAALCAAAPGDSSSVLTKGVSSLPRRFWTRREQED